MILSDLFISLSYGMLSNLRIGGDGSGTIPAEFQDRLLHQVNRGLVALHTRLLVSVKEVNVRAYDGITLYHLDPKYADTDVTVVAQKYISDSVFDPFLGDVIKVLIVTDEEGYELSLNDPSDPLSVFTPTSDSIQIPRAVTGDAYQITYQASHPVLVSGDLTQVVTIPEMLEEALEHYVAYRILSAMNGQEHAAKGSEHFQHYGRILSEIETLDSLSTSLVVGNEKFSARGFK